MCITYIAYNRVRLQCQHRSLSFPPFLPNPPMQTTSSPSTKVSSSLSWKSTFDWILPQRKIPSSTPPPQHISSIPDAAASILSAAWIAGSSKRKKKPHSWPWRTLMSKSDRRPPNDRRCTDFSWTPARWLRRRIERWRWRRRARRRRRSSTWRS